MDDPAVTTTIMPVEIILQGGHVVPCRVTSKQFDVIMRVFYEKIEDRVGYMRADENNTWEIAIPYSEIVAVRYRKDE